jgi:hypothetical protein
VTARGLAGWAADAFAGYDLAATHRIVTAATGPGPLPDYVSARVDPFTGLVGLPRPVGVVLARVSPATVDAVVRRVLLTRNALLVEGDGVADRVRGLADLAESAGAPAGVLQMLDGPAEVDVVLDPVPDAPVVVIVDEGSRVTVDGTEYTGIAHAIRVARSILRETGGNQLRIHSADPLRIAAALPVARVAVGDHDMPPPAPDALLSWTRIGVDRPVERQPWVSPGAPVPAYPRASNEPS